MSRTTAFHVLGTIVLTASFLPVIAAAQATRTWVSGVGDDANPCSRTAPCKTFAGAISKTAAKGEINVLDPGGYGAVTITKSISIIADGVVAGVLVSGTNGIIVNAASTDTIVLRGLDIEGLGTGLNGIRFLAGGLLSVENCTIHGFAQMGISFEPSTRARLAVSDTTIRNNVAASGGGIMVKPGAGVFAVVSLDNVRLLRNQFGLRVEDDTRAVVNDTISWSNNTDGFSAFGSGATLPSLMIKRSVASLNNGSGLRSEGGATVMFSDTTVTGNTTGLFVANGGGLVSFGTNEVFANASNGVPTSTQPRL